jgi:hypothetical protein
MLNTEMNSSHCLVVEATTCEETLLVLEGRKRRWAGERDAKAAVSSVSVARGCIFTGELGVQELCTSVNRRDIREERRRE